jgi:hypothetical protein
MQTDLAPRLHSQQGLPTTPPSTSSPPPNAPSAITCAAPNEAPGLSRSPNTRVPAKLTHHASPILVLRPKTETSLPASSRAAQHAHQNTSPHLLDQPSEWVSARLPPLRPASPSLCACLSLRCHELAGVAVAFLPFPSLTHSLTHSQLPSRATPTSLPPPTIQGDRTLTPSQPTTATAAHAVYVSPLPRVTSDMLHSRPSNAPLDPGHHLGRANL